MKIRFVLWLLRLLDVRIKTASSIEVVVLSKGDTPIFEADRIVPKGVNEDLAIIFSDRKAKAIVLQGGLRLKCFVRRGWLTEPIVKLSMKDDEGILGTTKEDAAYWSRFFGTTESLLSKIQQKYCTCMTELSDICPTHPPYKRPVLSECTCSVNPEYGCRIHPDPEEL